MGANIAPKAGIMPRIKLISLKDNPMLRACKLIKVPTPQVAESCTIIALMCTFTPQYFVNYLFVLDHDNDMYYLPSPTKK